MGAALWVAVVLACFRLASLADSLDECEIELECRECVPEHMPVVTSQAARGGRVRVAAGGELRLSCGGGALLAYPAQRDLRVVCEAGRYRVPLDGRLRHLLELGCQADVFEDVLHHVEHCDAPLQGRAYQTQSSPGTWRHLATLCYDADRAVTLRAHAVVSPHDDLRLAPHSDNLAPLTVLGNFNHMFDVNTRRDAEALFSDDASANRRLRELLKHDDITLGEQSITAARLLNPHYFDDQNARVTDFVSNKVVSWRSVALGNWRHVQRDVAQLARAARRARAALHVWAGARGAGGLRGAGDVTLRAGGRFPAPRYLWTVVLDVARRRGLALVVLNDPFVAVSEIKDSVFCESACSRVSWLRSLRRHRNYETPSLGLAFCCSLQNFTAVAAELPPHVIPHLDRYSMLTDLDLQESDTQTDSV